jgi:hypothetical protein
MLFGGEKSEVRRKQERKQETKVSKTTHSKYSEE